MKKNDLVPNLATGFFVAWILYALTSLVLAAAVIFVAFHFIMKFW